MSDTPRTDEARIILFGEGGIENSIGTSCVPIEFARQLERELAEAKQEIKDIAIVMVGWKQRATMSETDLEVAKAGVERLQRPKSIKVVAHSLEGNGFGAYLAGSLQDGEAIILLDLFACLAVDLDPSKTLAETMAHEVLHVCQEALGKQISESDINSAMAKIQGYELAEAEDLEQIIQDLTRQHIVISERAEKAEAEIKRLQSHRYNLVQVKGGKMTPVFNQELETKVEKLKAFAEKAMQLASEILNHHGRDCFFCPSKIRALSAKLQEITDEN